MTSPAEAGARPPLRGRSRDALLVGAVVLVALVLRLPTVGEQSFWLDEVYTGRIVDGSLGHAWSTIQRTENTPPLFYLLDWGWAQLFGTGEAALRSLSGVAGALAVLPAAALARTLGRDPGAARGAVAGTAALVAAVLVAVNPLAHWFSQEARSYGLFLLLAAVAWLALVRAADERSAPRLWAWVAAVVAASWTHYFGAVLLLVGWGALALLDVLGAREAGRRPRAALRPLVLPAAVSAVCVAALAPIARNQQSTGMYEAISLVKGLPARIVETPKQFAIGYNAPAENVLGAILLLALTALVVVGAWPRGGRPTPATLLLGAVAAVWAVPMLGLLVGFDVVLTRNFVLLIPPLAALAALGAARLGPRGLAVAGVVALVQLGAIVAVAVTPVHQRDDWRGAMAAAQGGQPTPQLLLISAYQAPAATYYSPTLRPVATADAVAVRSVVLLDRLAQDRAIERIPPPPAPAGFRLARAETRDQWRVFVWTAPSPTFVAPATVQALVPEPGRTDVLRP